MKFKEIYNIINNILRLEGYPVGISMLSYEPNNIDKIKKHTYWCRMFAKAREGETFYFTDKEQACPGATSYLGLAEEPADHKKGESRYFLERLKKNQLQTSQSLTQTVTWKTRTAALRTRRLNSRIPLGAVEAIAMSPLPQCDQTRLPVDVVLLTVTPEQGMKLIKAILWHRGGHCCGHTAGASCSLGVAYPYLTGNLNYFLADGGFRQFSALEPDKLLIGMPGEMLNAQTVENLQDVAAVADKYGMWP